MGREIAFFYHWGNLDSDPEFFLKQVTYKLFFFFLFFYDLKQLRAQLMISRRLMNLGWRTDFLGRASFSICFPNRHVQNGLGPPWVC